MIKAFYACVQINNIKQQYKVLNKKISMKFETNRQGALNKLGIENYHSFIIILHLYSIIIYTIIGGYYFLKRKELSIKMIYNESIRAG